MPIDYSALTAPYDRDAAIALAAHLRATGPTGRKYVGMGVAIDLIGSITFAIVILAMIPITISTFVHEANRFEPNYGILMPFVGLILGSAVFVWWLTRRYFKRTGSPEIWWRLDTFARANGMVFAPWSPNPDFPAPLFIAGVDPAAFNHVRVEGENFVNVGNLYFQVGRQNRESFDRRWGFVAVLLSEVRPSMLLDAKRNNVFGMNSLNTGSTGMSTLTLPYIGSEFRLRAPEQNLDQARLVFSESLIVALTKAKGTYDVQVSDRWLFFFSRGEFDMTDPDLLKELFGLVDVVRAAKL